MADQQLVINDFTGAIGTIGEKRDREGTGYYLRGLNVYEDASYVVNSRAATKISSTTITNNLKWLVDGSPWTSNRYAVDQDGKIYQINSSDVVSVLLTPTDSTGSGLAVFNDYLYYVRNKTIGRYGPLSNASPTDDDNFLDTVTPVVPGTFNFDSDRGGTAYGGGTGLTYTTPVAIAETATNRQTFIPTKDPVKMIQLNVVAKGTGNWTVTIHDAQNHTIATSTITNANLVVGRNFFVFSPFARIIRNNEYHFHVTSTVADGTVNTNVAADLEGAEFATYFGIIIQSEFNPMTVTEDKLIIGNDRYLAQWDEADYDPNKITFDSGFKTRTLAKFEEWVIAGTFKGNSIQESEDNRIFIWDTITPGFNSFADATIGIPQAIHNTRNNLVGVYGIDASIYTGTDPYKKVVDNVPFHQRKTYIEIWPGAITEYEGRTLIGYAAGTTDTAFIRGVYEFGSQVDETADSFNFPYTISTGNRGTTVNITLVKSIGQDLYIGWKDGSSYGLDKIDQNSNYSASGEWQSLIFDNDKPDKDKLPKEVIINFEPLTTGQSITPFYQLERGAWIAGTPANTVGDRRVELAIFNRFKELRVAYTYASSSNTVLKVYAVTLNYNDLKEERESA